MAAGGFDLCTGSGDLRGNQRRLLHVESAALGAGTQQGPGHTRLFQQQCAAAQVSLDAAAGIQRLLRACAQAQPVLLDRQQAKAGEGVEQLGGALFDQLLRLLQQQLAIRRRQQGQAVVAQVVAQRGEVAVDAPLHLSETPATAPLLAHLLHQGNRLVALRVADQQQQIAVERFLHTLFGLLRQFIAAASGQ